MSNTPLAGTGYGVQTAEIVPLLAEAGHDVAIAVNWGHYGTAIEWNGIPMFPAGKDKYSNDIIAAHAQTWRADWTITLYDVWPLVRDRFPERVASWVPIDHQPVSPEVTRWCRTVTPIAMSKFGQKMLAEQGIESHYIPHSLNTDIFRPTEATRSGHKPRPALGIPDDAFVVSIHAANQGVHPPRKAWAQMFLALGHFMREHPDAWAYIHTDKIGLGGLDLEVLATATNLPTDRVRWADPYSYASGRISQHDLAALYSMSDVLLASSMGEGFGIPVIEAQACGTPVIVSDFSAQPELVGAGWKVEGRKWWTPIGAWQFRPDIDDIVQALQSAYRNRDNPTVSQKARAHAERYDADHVLTEHMLPALDAAMERYEELKPVKVAA
jgi:glycosyltransferase involved in cell wall biosynthesis